MKLVTIKVTEQTKKNFNTIAAITGEKQYEVTERLGKAEVDKQIIKSTKKS
jgi:hypothetical protein